MPQPFQEAIHRSKSGRRGSAADCSLYAAEARRRREKSEKSTISEFAASSRESPVETPPEISQQAQAHETINDVQNELELMQTKLDILGVNMGKCLSMLSIRDVPVKVVETSILRPPELQDLAARRGRAHARMPSRASIPNPAASASEHDVSPCASVTSGDGWQMSCDTFNGAAPPKEFQPSRPTSPILRFPSITLQNVEACSEVQGEHPFVSYASQGNSPLGANARRALHQDTTDRIEQLLDEMNSNCGTSTLEVGRKASWGFAASTGQAGYTFRQRPSTNSTGSEISAWRLGQDFIIQSNRSVFLSLVWQFLEEPESSIAATWFARGVLLLIMASVFIATVNAHDHPLFPVWIETIMDGFFVLEIMVRFMACPNRFVYFLTLANWIDMIASMALLVRLALNFELVGAGSERDALLRALQCFPLLRLLKMLRRFEKLELLIGAFQIAFEALPVLMYMFTVIVMFFSTLVFFFEPGDNVASMPEAIYLCLVTISTVGYGDIYPTSTGGKITISLLIVMGSLYMAVPLGIVGGSFSTVWQDRDRYVLMSRTRTRLAQWGYTPQSIPGFFCAFDKDRDGRLDLGEFSNMIERLQLGLHGDRVGQLFRVFDHDGSGAIDDQEFVRVLFPQAYADIFRNDSADLK